MRYENVTLLFSECYQNNPFSAWPSRNLLNLLGKQAGMYFAVRVCHF